MIRLGFSVFLVLLAFVAVAGETAAVFPTATARDDRFELVAAQRTSCCPSRVDLVVRRLVDEESFTIQVEERIDGLEGVEPVAGEHALLHGRLRYGGEILAIVDLAARRHETTLWTYGHALAPAKDRLVYRTHYPRQAAGPRRSIVLLYDLLKSPAENRGGAMPRDWPEPNAGRPVFPRRNACTGSTDVALDNPYVVASPFLFSPDGQRIVFLAIDQTDSSAERSFLVRLDLARGACAGLAMAELDVRAMIQREDWPGPFRFSTGTLRWLDESAREVVAEQPAGDPFGERVVLPVP